MTVKKSLKDQMSKKHFHIWLMVIIFSLIFRMINKYYICCGKIRQLSLCIIFGKAWKESIFGKIKQISRKGVKLSKNSLLKLNRIVEHYQNQEQNKRIKVIVMMNTFLFKSKRWMHSNCLPLINPPNSNNNFPQSQNKNKRFLHF